MNELNELYGLRLYRTPLEWISIGLLMLVNAVCVFFFSFDYFDWNASSHVDLYEIIVMLTFWNEVAASIWCDFLWTFLTNTSNFFKVFGLITTI